MRDIEAVGRAQQIAAAWRTIADSHAVLARGQAVFAQAQRALDLSRTPSRQMPDGDDDQGAARVGAAREPAFSAGGSAASAAARDAGAGGDAVGASNHAAA